MVSLGDSKQKIFVDGLHGRISYQLELSLTGP
jgi:hypothetical protein